MKFKKKDEEKYIEIENDEYIDIDMYKSELFDIYSKHKREDFNTRKLNLDDSNCQSWEDERLLLVKDNVLEVMWIKPLYMLDHSGLTLSLSSFKNPWDSGQLGFLYVTKQNMKEYFGTAELTDEIKKR